MRHPAPHCAGSRAMKADGWQDAVENVTASI